MKRSTGNPSASGPDKICMENDSLAITVLPAAGGNISEITDRRTGRNWLWQNPHIPISNSRTGDDYGRLLDSGGWDEILFSVSPDLIVFPNNLKYPVADHGDLVRQRWTTDVSKDESGRDRWEMAVTGKTLNYDFRRVMKLHRTAPRLDIDYTLINHEEFAAPWYWCAHALIDVQPDMHIALPEGLEFRVDEGTKQTGSAQKWPTMAFDQGEPLDLSSSFSANGESRRFASKIFVRAPDSGVVAVEVPTTGERLSMRFDPEVLPWLGLWINNRGWSGCGSEPYLNLGLEPATTPYDSVSRAIDNDAISWLQPGESRQWSLTVELGS